MPAVPHLARTVLCAASVVMVAAARASAQPAVQVVSRHITVSDGTRLHVLEARPDSLAKDAPVIALVPGWSMPAAIWHQQLEALGASYHVIALDPRGQGESDVPARGYTLTRRTKDIAEFLKPYSHVVLVGWSLGALEVLSYCERYGEKKLAGVVLVDSSVGEGPRGPPGDFAKQLRANRAVFLDQFAHEIFRAPRDEDEIRAIAKSARRMPLDASIALLSYPVPREHWKQVVLALRAPLLYAVTSQFSLQASLLQEHRPATTVALFAESGHALFADDPARFNLLLGDFAQSVSHPPGGERR